MKATGIVRRIDDLGRVVIPKEIRRTMRIRDGEPLEIFTNNEGEVVFKKFSPIGEVGVFTSQYAEAINKSSGIPVAICDKDNVIAVSGLSKKDYLEKPISGSLSGLLDTRQTYTATKDDINSPSLVEGTGGKVSFLSPIVADGSVIGAVMSIKKAENSVPDDAEKKLISAGALFLSKQMEV